jgi:hypothetical protein
MSKLRMLVLTGVPGVGKTTVMRKLIAALGDRLERDRYRTLDYVVVGRTAVLGVYEAGEIFAGTDKLSMTVAPHAEAFVADLAQQSAPRFDAVAFEGDRLCGGKFIRHCQRYATVRVVALDLPPEVLAARREAREFETGKAQDAIWLKGRESKVANVIAEFLAERRTVETDEQVAALVEDLRAWLMGEAVVEVRTPLMLF